MIYSPKSSRLVALAIASLLLAGPLSAKEKGDDDERGNSRGKHSQKREDKEDKRADKQQRKDIKQGAYFDDQQRTYVRDYYITNYGSGKACPPGLAKKNNGCMPPGQAKKWLVGQRLRSDVVYYSVPQSVIIQLGAPPPSYRYVRVAADILLIAIGTNLVVDAIQDIGRF